MGWVTGRQARVWLRWIGDEFRVRNHLRSEGLQALVAAQEAFGGRDLPAGRPFDGMRRRFQVARVRHRFDAPVLAELHRIHELMALDPPTPEDIREAFARLNRAASSRRELEALHEHQHGTLRTTGSNCPAPGMGNVESRSSYQEMRLGRDGG